MWCSGCAVTEPRGGQSVDAGTEGLIYCVRCARALIREFFGRPIVLGRSYNETARRQSR